MLQLRSVGLREHSLSDEDGSYNKMRQQNVSSEMSADTSRRNALSNRKP